MPNSQQQQQHQNQHTQTATEATPTTTTIYHPVVCSECQTEVGVYDIPEKVYYFFNVMASEG